MRKNPWVRIAGTFVWENMDTGELVSVHGDEDQAFYVARKTVRDPDRAGAVGIVRTMDISPYFILRSHPIGEFGRASNAMIRDKENWQYGTQRDALSAAIAYMERRKGR